MLRRKFIIGKLVVLYQEILCRAMILSLAFPPLYHTVGVLMRIYLRFRKERI
jgi:hypothetical protein